MSNVDKKKKTLFNCSSVLLLLGEVEPEDCSGLEMYSGVCYNERLSKERMLQRAVFINKTRMLQRTQMLHRTPRNTIGRRRVSVRMTYRAIQLWLERQSSSLLSFVRFSYQFRSVICLCVQYIEVKKINFMLQLELYFLFYVIIFL
jgi:hypothetical protein